VVYDSATTTPLDACSSLVADTLQDGCIKLRCMSGSTHLRLGCCSILLLLRLALAPTQAAPAPASKAGIVVQGKATWTSENTFVHHGKDSHDHTVPAAPKVLCRIPWTAAV
jgi:hypothetical protein